MDKKHTAIKYKSSNSYTEKADKTITLIGFIVPIIMTIYGLLIQFNQIDSPNKFVGIFGFSLIMIASIAIGIIQLAMPGKTPVSSAIRLIEFHLLASIYFLFIAGIFNPFVACWPILAVAAYTYFDKFGLSLSLVMLAITTFVDAIFIHFNDISIAINDIVIFFTLTITSLIVVAVGRTHEIRKEKLLQSMLNASLQKGRIAAIVNNLTDAIISVDDDGIIRIYNAASLELLDTNNNLNGHNIDNILPLTDKFDNSISIFSELKQAKSVVRRDDLYYTFSDSEKIRLLITYAPIRNGFNKAKQAESHDGYIIIIRDITKEKSLDEERDEFVSVVSHELRTPITVAEGTISNVQMMMDNKDSSVKSLKEAVNVAHDQVLFLASMVNDLSSLSRAERGTSDTPEVIDVQEMAQNLIHKYTADAKAKKLKLTLDIHPTVGNIFASRLYVEELLQNFITNAIKYTKSGSVNLSITEKNKQINFAVKDTGIGISKTDQSKVFDKFYRSEDFRTRESSGTGLGLYVATKLAKKLNTKIELSSRLNIGSTFSFSLPDASNIPNNDPADNTTNLSTS